MTPIHSIFLKSLDALLRGFIKTGSLTVIDADGRRRLYGDGGEPRSVMRIHDPRLYAGLAFNPDLAAGEAYMDGTLTFEEGGVRGFLEVVHMNAAHLRANPLRKALREPARLLRRLHQHNTIVRARKNVAHHYDLSNDFFKLFLDDELNYSCAYFATRGESLEEAQKAKLRHVAAKLRIEPGMRVLDIGCGWGAMAIYLAQHLDAEVVGVTLSDEQQKYAAERAAALGLANQVDIRLADYRAVAERFDRIVSIGMFEHVGVPYYDEFFAKISDLLEDNGVALVHSIGRRGVPDTTGPWIRKYIFPGGYSPSLSEALAAIERRGLWACDIEILRLHYAETLKEWSRRFQANRARARAMFDERFCRMWEFFLITSELAFRHGGHMVFQVQLAKAVDAAPYVRDYIGAAETALRRMEEEAEQSYLPRRARRRSSDSAGQ
jgi:cyclopropane-fatty-acyl-phospholipid synthase